MVVKKYVRLPQAQTEGVSTDIVFERLKLKELLLKQPIFPGF